MRRAAAVATLVLAAFVTLADFGVSVSLTAAAASESTSSAGAGSTPQHGGSLTVDVPTGPIDLDVDTSSDNESIWALQDLAEPLFSNAPDGQSVVPWLATGYTTSANQLTWTITLRHGVRFSNGRPMTSRDVVWSISQAASRSDGANAYVDTAIKSVSADGPYAVVITTHEPWASLPADLAMYANSIFPDHFLGQSRAAFFQHPIGTGPFALRRWVKGRSFTMTRNRFYWQPGKPYLNAVTLRAVPDDTVRMAQLRHGLTEVIEGAPFSALRPLESAGLTVSLFPSSRIDYVTMNELVKPFRDPHVRLAIAEALNRSAIMQAAFRGHGEVANSPFMPGVPYYGAVGLPAYSLDAARVALAESAYPRGFTVDFLAADGDPIQTGVARMVASELAPLGIKVKVRLRNPAKVESEEHAFRYGMRETYWTNDIVDPDEYTAFTLCGSAAKCGGVYANFTHFDDPAIDALTEQGQSTLSSSGRSAIYQQIQKLAAAEVPMVWLGYSPFAYAASAHVHGLDVATQGNTHFENVWLSHRPNGPN